MACLDHSIRRKEAEKLTGALTAHKMSGPLATFPQAVTRWRLLMIRQACVPLALGLMVIVTAPVAAEKPQGLKGSWKIVSAEREGKEISQYLGVVVTFDDNSYSAKLPNGETGQADVKLDTKQKPWTIDIIPHYGANDGKHFKGICKVEG